MERFFVSKDKFGNLVPRPLFGKEVIFFRVINPPPDGKEGEEWECEVLSTTHTNKKDKNGKDILIRTVRFLSKVEHKTVKFNHERKKWEVETFCGKVLVKKEFYPSDSIEFVFRAPCVVQIAKFREYSKEIASTWIRTPEDIPAEAPEEVKNEVIGWLNKVNQADQEEKAKLEAVKQNMISIINNSPKTFPTDILRDLVTKGWSVVFESKNPRIPTESLYVFDIAGFRFDKDGEYSSCGKVVDSALKSSLQKIASFLINPTPQALFKLLGLATKPEQKTIFNEQIPIESHGQTSRGSKHTKYCKEDEAVAQLKRKIDEVKSSLSEEVVETSFQDLVRIVYACEFVERIHVSCDAREYDSFQDYHYLTYAQGTLTQVWRVKDYYISPEVCEKVKQLLLRVLTS